MMQQINLYQPMFRKQRKVFSAVAMLQVTAFFIVVLSTVYFYNVMKMEPFTEELDRANEQFAKMSQQIEEISKQFPKQGKSRLLESELNRLTTELDSKGKIKEALTQGSFGNADGFSEYFEALARGHVNGAWLTDIKISEGGSQLSLSGNSIDPELVPVYMKRLAESEIFDNQKINILELFREESEPNIISFNVGTGG